MAPPDPPAARPPAAAPTRALVMLGLGGLLLLVMIPGGVGLMARRERLSARTDPGPSRGAGAGYAGSRICRDCHPGEAAAHAGSGHARTLRPIGRTSLPDRLGGLAVADPERPGVTWSYAARDGTLAAERREAGAVERLLVDYAFGSGRHAVTFGTLTDRTPDRPAMLEHRLTVFAHRASPDITPGQAVGGNPSGLGPLGRAHEGPGTLQCFGCHATTTSDRGPGRLDEATMIPNVECERCHGPGRAHVEAARRGADAAGLAMPFGPGRASADDELRLCGACHRLPGMGDPGLIRTDNPVLVRFQPVGLMQSACYRRSRGSMACSTCHDPHARTSTDRASYEAACLSCHQGPSKTPCPVSTATGCVGCHMPRRDVSRGMMMTDHWIRRRPESAPAAGTAEATP